MNVTDTYVFCKDCVHCDASLWARIFKTESLSKAICKNSGGVRIPDYDLVTGVQTIISEGEQIRCSRERQDHSGRCGSDAKNWKPRSKDGLLLYLKRCGPK